MATPPYPSLSSVNSCAAACRATIAKPFRTQPSAFRVWLSLCLARASPVARELARRRQLAMRAESITISWTNPFP
jgi:hypothetical protein